ncbi:MAG TPA: HD domain-containing protein [Acidimicrobiia bacterium]
MLDDFLAMRRHPKAVAPRQLSDRLVGLLDVAVRQIALDAALERVAVVATGGYGARTLCLGSDVDLMILHSRGFRAADARRVFGPLWDAGLRVGHAVRTPKQALELARSSPETLSSLLTTRLVAGDPDLLGELDSGMARLVRRRSDRIRNGWVGEEERRRASEPYLLMACDVKTGRGGIRALQILEWDRIARRTRGETPDEREDEETEAWRVLLEVRNALHAVTGRAHDRYDFDVRAGVAEWLDLSVAAVGEAVVHARRSVESLLTERFPDRLRRPAASPKPHSTPITSDPVAASALHAAMAGRPMSHGELRPVDAPLTPSTGMRRAVVWLLQPGWPRVVFGQLVEAGWLSRSMPELAAVLDMPHAVAFHAHPVFDHLVRTVDELASVLGEPGHPVAALDEHERELLGLAALVHDVGKGTPGDHSEAGAAMMSGLGERLGLGQDGTDTLATLVRHHLLLPDLATRFDLSDEQVIAEAVDAIGDQRVLDMLYVLTVADSRATGSDTWSAWKASLLRRAHAAVQAALRGLSPARRSADQLAGVVARSGAPLGDVLAHLRMLPASALAEYDPQALAAQTLAVTPPPMDGEARVTTATREATGQVVLCTKDRPALLATAAGVLAVHGLSVIDARVLTRRDGVVIDTFEVVEELTRAAPASARLQGAADDLVHTIVTGRDIEPHLAEKRHAYRAKVAGGIATGVRLERRPQGALVEVRCADRLGLLHDLAQALARHDLGITRARIDTNAGEVVDVFHTMRAPRDPAALERDIREIV